MEKKGEIYYNSSILRKDTYMEYLEKIKEFLNNINADEILNNEFDGILIKQLAKSNVLTEDGQSNQTHIAITGESMDFFPYLNNYKYLEAENPNIEYKRKFVLKLRAKLLSNNLNYMKGIDLQENQIIESFFTTARSRRKDGMQLELSYLNLDDEKFIELRSLIHQNDYIVFLKLKEKPEYVVFAIKANDAETIGISNKMDMNKTVTEVDIHTINQESIVEDTDDEIVNLILENKNVILYGVPGTGKTYRLNGIKKYFDKSCFVTFHQSYEYEEFVEGINSKIVNNQIVYEPQNGIFKQFCEEAKNNPTQRYVMFIDEINRGNISKIFGELITLIEKGKRAGEKEEVKVTLPYSKTTFSVPNNIYIVGTMNTADKSIALIDSALRRRFFFIELVPNFELFDNCNQILKKCILAVKVINERIIQTIDKDHRIGNSYFIELLHINDEEKLIKRMKNIWLYQILPLLQDYYFMNPEDISDILYDLIENKSGNASMDINYNITNQDFIKAINQIKDFEE